MATTKELLVPVDTVGQIDPEVNAATFEITDITLLKTIRAQGLSANDKLDVVCQNYGSNGWEVLDGAQLNTANKSITLAEIGVFSVRGDIEGNADGKPIVIYTEEA